MLTIGWALKALGLMAGVVAVVAGTFVSVTLGPGLYVIAAGCLLAAASGVWWVGHGLTGWVRERRYMADWQRRHA